MKSKPCFKLIAKFGTKEHINNLKNGEIFFNSIKTYRDHDTGFRGDPMEGCIPINPKTLKIYDSAGMDISQTIPYPDTVVQLLMDDDDLMMFCAATITKQVLEKNGDYWRFTKQFADAVEDFGSHVMLLWTLELLKRIENATDTNGQRIGYDSGLILYRDLNDFEHTEEYRKTGSQYDKYFVKSEAYRNQNVFCKNLFPVFANLPLQQPTREFYA